MLKASKINRKVYRKHLTNREVREKEKKSGGRGGYDKEKERPEVGDFVFHHEKNNGCKTSVFSYRNFKVNKT